MKEVLRALFEETLEDLRVDRLPLPLDELRGHARGRILAFGKAAFRMVERAREVVPFGGVAVAPAPPRRPPPDGIRALVGGHPYPDERSLAAADALLAEADGLGPDDLALFLVSGGGSALAEKPLGTLAECRAWNEALVTGGAGIVDMNVVRKHLSLLKGGRLAARAAPARQVTLYVSDVPAGSDDAVASGPTMPDPSTVAECRAIAGRLGLALPDEIPETPKPGDPVFARSTWHRLLDGADAMRCLARRAEAHGWSVEIDASCDDAPVDRAVEHLLARLDAMPSRPAAIVSGGELSCPVTGDGTGGRNAAFVLRCVPRIAGRRFAVLSAGTDGIDGNSPAAGAVADGHTAARAPDHEERHENSDAYTYFAALGDAVVTGPTENNVRDLRILVAW